jgi:4-diphosphocytidyl-2C-methyl-D-erythritol kinase
VSAFIRGRLGQASGGGQVVRNVGSFTGGWLVLGVGAEEISAADAYEAFDEVGSSEATSFVHNDLEAAACRLVPGLVERLDAMRAATGGVAFVSGSGPTVVGVVGAEDRAHEVAEAVRPHFADALITQPCPWGVRLRMGGDSAADLTRGEPSRGEP